jgi:anti-anti-sigma factor
MENSSVVVLAGRIDALASQELERTIGPALDGLPAALVLDFAVVDFLSSAGLRVMLATAKRCRKQNTKLALHSLKPEIVEVFQLSGLTDFFPVLPDRAAALQAVGGTATGL